MASDNHASYARIGFTVFIGVAAIVGTLLYLGGVRGRDDEIITETYYDKPVSGLSVGSVVNFRGVKVGEVRDISFVGTRYEIGDGADNSRIYIQMAIKVDALGGTKAERDVIEAAIRRFVHERGLRATVTTSGITGLSRIELNFHPQENLQDPVEIRWTPEHVYIPSKPSLLENFSVAATKVMNQINRMDLSTVWSNISSSVESVARMTDGAKTILETERGNIERIADNLADASASLKGLAADLKRNPSLLLRENKPQRIDETE